MQKYLSFLLVLLSFIETFSQNASTLYLSSAGTGRVYSVNTTNGRLTAITSPAYFNQGRGNAVSSLALGYDYQIPNSLVFMHANTTFESTLYKNGVSTGESLILPADLGGLTTNNVSGPYFGFVYGMSGKKMYRAYPTKADLGTITGDAIWTKGTAFATDVFFDYLNNYYCIITYNGERFLYKINLASPTVATQVAKVTGPVGTVDTDVLASNSTSVGNGRGAAYLNGFIYLVSGTTTDSDINFYKININNGVSSHVGLVTVSNTKIGAANLDLASVPYYVPFNFNCTGVTLQGGNFIQGTPATKTVRIPINNIITPGTYTINVSGSGFTTSSPTVSVTTTSTYIDVPVNYSGAGVGSMDVTLSLNGSSTACVIPITIESIPLCSTGDCNPNTFINTTYPATIEYDNIVSTFHSTILKEADGKVIVWGQGIHNDGVSDVNSPIELNASNYPRLTGKVLKFTGGSKQLSGSSSLEGDQQFAVLTEDGLFVWGDIGYLISTSIKNTADFEKITINGQANGLPAGVTPKDVKMLFGSYKTLALVTCSGEAWVLSDFGNKNGSGSNSSTIWHRVYKATANDGGTKGNVLDKVIAIRGTAQALIALTLDGELYTWGAGTYTGTLSGSGPTNRTYATLMANPTAGKTPKMIGMTKKLDNEATYYVLMTDGTLYSMGNNGYKQLGNGSTTNSISSWVQVKKSSAGNDFMTNIAWISPNEHEGGNLYSNISALTTDGKLYSWGINSGKMLGGATDNANYDPWQLYMGRGLENTDIISALETGGHTTMIIKSCTTRFGYIGHKIHGSMGDGKTGVIDGYENTFNFSDTYPVNVCGAESAPRVIDLKKCEFKTANLADAEPTNLANSGYSIQWFLADMVTPVPNTTAVGEGTYVAKFIPDSTRPLLCSDMTTTIRVTDYTPTDPEYATCAPPICYNDPVTGGSNHDTKVGITLLKRAGEKNKDNWPMLRKSGHIALESNTRGFVPTRMTTAQLETIKTAGNAVEGMMSYDTDANCMKIYDGSDWKCFNTPSCP